MRQPSAPEVHPWLGALSRSTQGQLVSIPCPDARLLDLKYDAASIAIICEGSRSDTVFAQPKITVELSMQSTEGSP